MSTESKSQLPTRDQIDKRVPPEVWERILIPLYPSQLTRMSMVNKTLNKIVSSLAVWSRMFSVTFGPTMRLRTLSNMSESKSYMLYMCARSLYICEMCLSLAKSKSTGGLYFDDVRPTMTSALAPMPTLTKGDIQYLGEEINQNWTVWMCLSCSRKPVSEAEIVDDEKTMQRIRWYRVQH